LSLVWDYKNGFVVDAETGEVVDTIYVASPVDGLEGDEREEREHYALLKQARFEAVDVVAEQIRKLKLTPTWRETYAYMKLHSDDRKSEKKLLEVFRLALAFLTKFRSISEAEKDLVERIARDAFSLCSGCRVKLRAVAFATAYVAGKLLKVALPRNDMAKFFGLGAVDVDRALWLARELSVKYKCDRVGVVVSEIEKAASELGYPELGAVAKVLLSRCRDVLSGKSSKSMAAALLYIASTLLDKPVYVPRIARAVGVSDHNTRLLAKAIANHLGVEIKRSRAGAVASIAAPAELCREIEKIAKLAIYVKCR